MPRSQVTNEPMVPVLYLDLDGTVRWGADQTDGAFVNGPGDVRVFDGVADLMHEYKKLGWRIVGVSNQGGIALGYMTPKACAQAMHETQKQTRNAFDKITWCSHHPDASTAEMATCWCRKPRAGLVIEAALDLSAITGEIYPPHMAVFVGDRPEDEGCAKAANIKFEQAEYWRAGLHLDEIRAAANDE